MRGTLALPDRRAAIGMPRRRAGNVWYRPTGRTDIPGDAAREFWRLIVAPASLYSEASTRQSADMISRLRPLDQHLAHGYKFVHAGYIPSMELYSGRTGKFMLNGHESPSKRQDGKNTDTPSPASCTRL